MSLQTRTFVQWSVECRKRWVCNGEESERCVDNPPSTLEPTLQDQLNYRLVDTKFCSCCLRMEAIDHEYVHGDFTSRG